MTKRSGMFASKKLHPLDVGVCWQSIELEEWAEDRNALTMGWNKHRGIHPHSSSIFINHRFTDKTAHHRSPVATWHYILHFSSKFFCIVNWHFVRAVIKLDIRPTALAGNNSVVRHSSTTRPVTKSTQLHTILWTAFLERQNALVSRSCDI